MSAIQFRSDPFKWAVLTEIAIVFLKLGTTAFGGPAAHLSMMEEEFVRRRKWLSQQEFLDLWGITNLIPGPNSTEMAIHLGYRRAGWAGLWVAGVCFILPATIIVGLIAWLYVLSGHLPALHAVFEGVKPVILAIIAQAIWSLSRTALKDFFLTILAILVLVANLLGIGELSLIFGAGFVSWLRFRGSKSSLTLSSANFELAALFGFFLKTGSVLFGSGYVLIAFLRSTLVEDWKWLTETQLLDAIAVGQFTPGPVFTTATFIGYLVSGPSGAAVATVGVFLPAFVFVALSAPFLPRMRSSKNLSKLLDGLNAASWAVMAAVLLKMAPVLTKDGFAIVLFAVSLWILIRYRWNSAWLVFVGALIGGLRILI